MDPVVLKERFDLLCEKNSDMGPFMHYILSTVDAIDATKVIELGVRYGASTIAWLYALQQTRGQLWSVDCSFPVVDPETGIELLNSQGPLGCVDYWTFLLGNDTDSMILDALPGVVDIVFIDTQHTYEQTLRELSLYYGKVRNGGRILLHDTALEVTGNAVTPQPPFPVRTAMLEFCKAHSLEDWDFEGQYPGMGTIYC